MFSCYKKIGLIVLAGCLVSSSAFALNISRLQFGTGLRVKSDFGSEPPPPTCFDNGDACTANSQCCSGNCDSLLCAPVVLPPRKPILCFLGDSITRGSNDDTCQGQPQAGPTTTCFGYRDHLQDLIGVGIYDIVGDFKEPATNPTYDVDHAGVPGQKTSQILARLPAILSNKFVGPVPAGSIFLIHAGTNDIRTGGSQTTAVNNVLAMINQINNHDPNITIYVALITPLSTATTNYNTALKAALETRQLTKTNLHIVNMEAAMRNLANCSPTYVACMSDGLHPDDTLPYSGYQVMANTWYSCLQNTNNTYCDGH